ncbi:hypothetical protein BDN72DRAFT_75363 [Pluteus cervinus]|uniref:Uncharacterized protein n=1 Tax=Pluteus cervinus TaxID=181527 RepID=A0ACD2ZYE7_9AGAR|nr:hypothetical protein BDN72DRAFT_75363 [Pluteus cervinus]
MISAHQYQQESNNGKIVWCHTAKIDAIPPESTLSTDIYSDRTSFGLSGLEFYRSAYLRWGEASTTAAYLSWDRSQCAGHFERVVCGSRLFFVSRPKREDNTQFLYDPAIISTHESNDIVSQHWDIEAVIVPAGSDIYIRPFTPYASVSLESSVSHGAYFIPCAMIERVIVGLYQSWANTGEQYSYHVGIEHASRAILFTWRDKFVSDTIDQNEHIPDLETPEGVRQLFCLCGYRELVNICSQDSYESDDFSQGLSIHDRRGFIHGRQVSRGLLRWFFGNFALEGSQDSLKEVYFKYLAAVVKCMLGQQRKYGTGGITSERMEEFVSLTFGGSPEFMEPYQSNEVTPSYGGQLDGTIVRLPASDRLTNWHETHDDGATAEDRIWVAAQMKAMREKNDGV